MPAVSVSASSSKCGDIGRQAFAFADDLHPDAALVQFGEVAADEELQQPHQVADLGFRPRPVFRREGVDGQPGDAHVGGGADGLAQRLDAGAMAGDARQAARLRPAAIAIHDDRDMLGRRHLFAFGPAAGEDRS